MARKVVLAGACRTAIGVMGGTLSKTPAPDLGTVVIKEALKRTGIKPEQVDEVYMGCVIQAGLGQNPARQAAVNAGIPVEVPATTINVLCGSGMHCVNLAAKLIASGDADIIVAGGMENMSMAPYLLYNARFGYRMGAGKMDDALIRDALTDAFGGYHMGITAENIAEDWGLTAMFRCRSKVCKNQITSVAMKITVKARCRKSFALSQSRCPTFLAPGIR